MSHILADRKARRMLSAGKLPGVSKVKVVEAKAGSSKKYTAVWEDHSAKIRRTSFGARGYEDYLQHKDPVRRQNFRSRFRKLFEQNSNNPKSALYWAWLVGW